VSLDAKANVLNVLVRALPDFCRSILSAGVSSVCSLREVAGLVASCGQPIAGMVAVGGTGAPVV
jgi:hypothetical protein